MNTHEAISRLSKALALLATDFEKEELRALVQDLADKKHQAYIEIGLATNDTTSIMHGVMGMLSHYESIEQQEHHEKRLNSLKQD